MGFTSWSYPPVSDCEAHSMPTHNAGAGAATLLSPVAAVILKQAPLHLGTRHVRMLVIGIHRPHMLLLGILSEPRGNSTHTAEFL
jgi:hypothetical protein